MQARFFWDFSFRADGGQGTARPSVPGMDRNYRDERNSTEPMAVTVAERQGQSREGEAERSRKQMCERRNTNGQRGRVRATSWLGTAKSKGHQDASGRVRRRAQKVHVLTRGDIRRESAGEVSKDRSSDEARRKQGGAKGRRTERLEEESGERTERNEDGVGRGNYAQPPHRKLRRRSGAAAATSASSFRGHNSLRPSRMQDWRLNRRMRKTARPVVWEGRRAQSRHPDPHARRDEV